MYTYTYCFYIYLYLLLIIILIYTCILAIVHPTHPAPHKFLFVLHLPLKTIVRCLGKVYHTGITSAIHSNEGGFKRTEKALCISQNVFLKMYFSKCISQNVFLKCISQNIFLKMYFSKTARHVVRWHSHSFVSPSFSSILHISHKYRSVICKYLLDKNTIYGQRGWLRNK